LKVSVRGVAEEFAADKSWREIEIALLDVETTGRDASVDRVVELGIVVGRGGVVIARYNWLVNPGIPIPEEVRAVHGISDDDVKDKPRFEAVAHEIAAALKGCVPAAYNAAFDRAFVMGEFARAKTSTERGFDDVPALRREVDWIDPLVWARDIQSDEKSRALGDVAARLGITLENAHRASDDAEAALLVLYALGRDTRVPMAYGAFVQEQRRLAQKQSDERRFWRS
jgi:DNA polymerase-3 subunit epsilon